MGKQETLFTSEYIYNIIWYEYRQQYWWERSNGHKPLEREGGICRNLGCAITLYYVFILLFNATKHRTIAHPCFVLEGFLITCTRYACPQLLFVPSQVCQPLRKSRIIAHLVRLARKVFVMSTELAYSCVSDHKPVCCTCANHLSQPRIHTTVL